MRLLSLVVSLALLGSAAPAAPSSAEAASQRRLPRAAPCQMIGAGEWTAHVNAMPGPRARRSLIVTGALRVKPAARATLRLDPAAMESDPPQYTVILDVRLPREPTIDMLTRREVRGEWPVRGRVGAVHIRCGGRIVASVRDVVTAH